MAQLSTTLYINPSYVTFRPVYPPRARTYQQFNATAKMRDTTRKDGTLSKNAERKIRLAVQWLVYLAKLKRVKSAVTGREHDYRAGLLTLSLPSGCADITPKFFRDVLLVSMLDTLRYHYDLKNYVWKIERQKKGALHVHITLDQYIPYQFARQQWCKILDKHGLLEAYRNRFKNMRLKEYVTYRIENDAPQAKTRFDSHRRYIEQIIRSKRKGDSQNWSLPNCTDIHSVKNIKNLAAYMAKYLAKDANLAADFKGRFWSCSYSLSRLRSIKCEVPIQVDSAAFQDIKRISTRDTEMYKISDNGHDAIWLGSVFYLGRSRFGFGKSQIFSSVMGYVSRIYHGFKDFEPPSFTWDPHHGTELISY